MRTSRILGLFLLGTLAGCTAGTDTDKDDTQATDTVPDSDSETETETQTDTPPETDVEVPGLDTLTEADLTVVEVMANPAACSDDEGEYIEILYSGAAAVDLAGLVISDQVASYTIPAQAVVQPGQRILVARNTGGLNACYGVTADFQYGLGLNNAGDAVTLTDGGSTTFDTVDLTQFVSTTEIASGIAYERDDSDDSLWCRATTPIGTTTDLGSPGTANGICGVDTDPTDLPVDTDTLPGLDTVSDDELTITEFMANVAISPGCADSTGEYIEVLYSGQNTVNLEGLVVSDVSTNITINQRLVAQPGQRLIFARNLNGFNTCYGFTADAQVILALNNTGDQLSISNGLGLVYDEVDFLSWDIEQGFSWERDDVDDTVWCLGEDPIGTSGNNGTPGADNGICVIDTDTNDTDIALDLEDLDPGDLTIVEFMADPSACSDPTGEFLEIQYNGAAPVNLSGLRLADAAGNRTFFFANVIMLPGDLVVLYHDTTPGGCYALSGLGYDSVTLNNSGDVIYLETGSGLVLDSVNYNGWSVPRGRSLQLDAFGTWCPSTDRMPGSVDFGTPGSNNVECIFATDTDTDLPDPTDEPDTDFSFGNTAVDLQPGELVITEFMADVGTATCTDAAGEYIELLYLGADPIDLFGLRIEDDSNTTTFTGHYIMQPGDRVVLAANETTLTGCYPGVTSTISFGFGLNNTGDEISIFGGSQLIDTVDFSSWTISPGVAWERDDVTAGTWCLADTPISTTADLGSPGAANGLCPTDTDTDTDVPETDTDTDLDPCVRKVDYTATVVTVQNSPFGSSSAQLRLTGASGFFTYNTCLSDQDVRAEVGVYEHFGSGDFFLAFDAIPVTVAGSGNSILTVQDFPSSDVFRIEDGEQLGFPGNRDMAVNGTIDADLSLFLTVVDGSGAAITGDGAPIPFPMSDIASYTHTFSLSQFGTGTVLLQFDTIGEAGQIDTDVPETDIGTDVPETDTDTNVVDTVPTDVPDTDVPLGVDDLAVGDLRITEFMALPAACNVNGAEFVEIQNLTNRIVNLDGLQLSYDVLTVTVSGFTELDPGDTYVFASSLPGFELCYGFSADSPYFSTLSDTGAVLSLLDSADRTLDSVDYTSWNIVAGRSWMLDTTDTLTWCLASAPTFSGDLATPNSVNGACVFDTDTDETDLGVLTVDDLGVGDVLITEFQLNPTDSACVDAEGEYIELLYVGPTTADLTGMELFVLAGPEIVGGSLIVEPGDRILLAHDLAAFDACYGYQADMTFVRPLQNGGDNIRVGNGTVFFDQVDSRGWTITEGVAQELDDVDNVTWCPADTILLAGTLEFGTPGFGNGACPVIGETDTDIEDTDVPLTGADTVLPSELTISEFMATPAACADADGEYIELLYTGTSAKDLQGLMIGINGATVTVSSPLVVFPNDTVLLARSAVGLANCYAVNAALSFSLNLPDVDGTITISNNIEVLATVDYSVWNLRLGRAVQQDPTDDTLWCSADVLIPGTQDFGTPSFPNNACSTDIETDLPQDTDTDVVNVPQDLMITEVVDYPANRSIRYVEVYNPGPDPAPLDGWEILLYGNGSSTSPLSVSLDSVTLPVGEEWVVGRLTSSQFYIDAFGRVPDQLDISLTGNGNDAYVLAYQGVPVDVYGEVGVDGTGTAWDYTAKIANRVDTVTQSSNVWIASEWVISSDPSTVTYGYFGEVDTDVFVDTDTNTTPTDDTDTLSTDLVLPGPDDLVPGELVITEFMANPANCAGTTGEYVEVQNRSGLRINLEGLRLETFGAVGTISTRVELDAGSLAVLARNASGFQTCYGFAADAQTGVALSNLTEVVSLVADSGTVLDSYSYGLTSAVFGVAWERDELDDTTWCVADTPTSNGDLGSPGQPNGTCVIPDTDPTDIPDTDPTDTVIEPTDTPDTDTNVTPTDDTDLPLLTLGDLGVGDLRITEVMADPDACSDFDGQYLEVLYSGPSPVDISGLQLSNSIGNTRVFLEHIIVVPGERFIIARDDSTIGTCYPGASSPLPGFGWRIVNTSDVLEIEFGSTVFSTSEVNGLPFSVGIARELSSDGNGLWCDSTNPIGTTGDFGTPGASNGTCIASTADRSANELTEGELTITEFMANPITCSDADAEYFEIRYNGVGTVDFFGLRVADVGGEAFLDGPRTVSPGDHVVVARSLTGFETCYGFAADVQAPLALGNNGDVITATTLAGTFIAEANFDPFLLPAGLAWTRDDGDDDLWCQDASNTAPINGTLNFGSPGVPNGTCPIDTDPTDIPVDTDPTDIPVETDLPLLTVFDLSGSMITVTEIMVNPAPCNLSGAQFVEILYTGPSDADLAGLNMNMQFAGAYVFPPNSIVTPGQRFLVGKSGPDFAACYGRTPDFIMPQTLESTGESILLAAPNGFTLDVPPPVLTWLPGRSAQLDTVSPAFCSSDTLTPGGAYATPGEPNLDCSTIVIVDTDVPVDTVDTDLIVDTDIPVIPVANLNPAAFLLSEFMADPVACSDADCEFIEFVIIGTNAVDLQGLVVSDGTNSYTVPVSAVVQPFQPFTIARNPAGLLANYGAQAQPAPNLVLDHTAGSITVTAGATTLVSYTWSTPLPSGASWQQDGTGTGAFCVSTTPIPGSTDLGTPGAFNPACP